ncbi:MAG: exopolyphosphatase, partial [Pseudomonadota bacterium]|nr:exopolyphosphatase [Pseudomonadota bacterium]
DQAQAARVEKTALVLLKQVAGAWQLLDPPMQKMLTWAARLHEAGIAISYNQYHRHGAYILENANLAGFSRQQQRVLGAIVRSQRQKYQRESFDSLPEHWRGGAMRLAILLRLSVTLNRGRSNQPLPPIGIRVRGDKILVTPPVDWLKDHPLTEADLETERQYLEKGGFLLKININNK